MKLALVISIIFWSTLAYLLTGCEVAARITPVTESHSEYSYKLQHVYHFGRPQNNQVEGK